MQVYPADVTIVLSGLFEQGGPSSILRRDKTACHVMPKRYPITRVASVEGGGDSPRRGFGSGSFNFCKARKNHVRGTTHPPPPPLLPPPPLDPSGSRKTRLRLTVLRAVIDRNAGSCNSNKVESVCGRAWWESVGESLPEVFFLLPALLVLRRRCKRFGIPASNH